MHNNDKQATEKQITVVQLQEANYDSMITTSKLQ